MKDNKKVMDILFYILASVIPAGISFMIMPIFAKYLSLEEFGIIGYLGAISSFLMPLTLLGVHSYLFKEYYKYDKIEKQNLINQIFFLLFFFNLLFFLIEIFIFKYIMIKQIKFYPYLLLMLANIFFSYPLTYFNIYNRVEEKPINIFVITFIKVILSNTISLILVIVYSKGVVGKLLGELLINFTLSIWIFTKFLKFDNLKNRFFNKENFKVLKFGIIMLPGIYSFLILDLSDRIILEKYVEISKLGIYTLSYSFASLLRMLGEAVYKVIEPIFYKNEFSQNKIFKIKLIFIFGISFVAILYLVVVNITIDHFLSEKYKEAKEILPLLLIGNIFFNVYLIELPEIVKKNKVKIITLLCILSAIINLTLNIYYVKKYGIYAAAYSTIVAFIFLSFSTVGVNKFSKYKNN